MEWFQVKSLLPKGKMKSIAELPSLPADEKKALGI